MPPKPGKFIWITNGENEIKIKSSEDVPEGYTRGRCAKIKNQIRSSVIAYGQKLTEDDKAKISENIKLGLASISEEDKQAAIEKRKNTFKHNIEALSEDERKCRYEKTAIKCSQIRQNMTEEQKLTSAKKCSETKKGWSEEKRMEVNAKIHDYWKSLTDEQKENRLHNLMTASREWFSNEENKKLCQQKISNTKRKNGTFNTSCQEDRYYAKLLEIYDTSDIIRQYSDSRYPFKCDFYIKSKDLFIECNFHWTHGGLPYDSSDARCIEQLNQWNILAKQSKYYEAAIITWTIRDVIKRNTALKNKLNYEVLYNEP